jgi:feruloyl esterase
MLPALEEWVEKGVAPDKIIATQYAGNQQGGGFANPTEGGTSSGEVLMTRPLFPYPLAAQYDGQGAPSKADSFVPEMTPGGADGHYDWVSNDLFQ